MAHANMNKWVSMLVGQDIEVPPPTSLDEIPAARTALDFIEAKKNLPDLAQVYEGVELRQRNGTRLTAEIYVPHGEGPFPVVVYGHGGGFVAGEVAGVRKPAMSMAAQGYVVVNVDYGLAPEHPFPWALEDILYACRWVRDHIAPFNGDPNVLFASGDSAGANLAAATIVALEMGAKDLDEGDLAGVKVEFAGAVLFFGGFDLPRTLLRPGAYSGLVEVWWHRGYLGPHFATKRVIHASR